MRAACDIVCALAMLVALPALAGTIISPTGGAYRNVSANSEYSAAFPALNLFNKDVTGLAVGAPVETGSGSDWAVRGTGPGYVEFELDQAYLVGSVFYAQRIGGDPNLDKVTQISLWGSSTTPFSPADPGSLPLAVLTITNKQSGIWAEYPLAAPVAGRYFLLKMEQSPRVGGNIGGNELRLGATPPDTTPPSLVFVYPAAGATVRHLTAIEVNFSEPVDGVDATDLVVNGRPATQVASVTPSQFIFSVPLAVTGVVQVAWASNHGIHDQSSHSNAFAGGNWFYTLDPSLSRTDVILSEFMASNSGQQTNSLRDELGNSPDWIELHNSTDGAVDLTGWFLTDDARKLTKWSFPPLLLPAQSYLVVFASGRNTNIAGRLHTNFKLSAEGSFLALLDPATNIVSAFTPAYRQQFPDISYGCDRLDPTLTGYFTNATPGAPNATRGAGFASEVLFSRQSGTFVSPFQLVLTTADTNSEIRYLLLTTNVPAGGMAVTNIPTASSLLYTGPVPINQTVQVRARAFPKQPGFLPGPPCTESFVQLTPQAAAFTSDLPIILLHNLAGGTVPASTDQNAVVMVFEPAQGRSSMTNPPTLVTRAGLNLRGRSTGGFPKASFALEAWDEYNQDRDVPFCGLPEESDWVLYAPNCFDLPLLHNPFIHQVSRDLGRYSSRTRFAELFLNTSGGAVAFSAPAGGNYHGIYVVEEKIKRSANRVDVTSLEPDLTNAPAISGGYLFKVDSPDPDEVSFSAGGITGAGSQQIYQYPPGPEMVSALRAAQNAYFTNYLNSFAAVLQSPTWTNPVTGYAQYFDVEAGIDHHLLNVLGLNVDAFRLSGYIHKPRNGKITMGPLWDFDRAMGASRGDDRPFNPRSWRGIDYDFSTDFFNASQYYNNAWYHRMFEDPDFWQRYIDRYQELRDQLWSTNHLFGILDSLAGQLRAAQPREVARWRGSGASDTSPRTGVVSANGYTYDFGSQGTYQGEIDFLKKWLADRLGFIDTNFLARPHLSCPGGPATNGFTVSLSGAAESGTTVYYTLDGTDPRLPGGALAANARVYAGPILLTNNARVVARAFNHNHRNLTGPHNPPLSSSWSGMTAETYVLNRPPLALTELMYHPLPSAAGTNNNDDFEFIELKNTSAQPLSLPGIRFTNGIEFTFTTTNAITTLGPGQYLVLVANRAAFLSRYGNVTNIAGEYSGHLDNGGELLYLEGPLKEPILEVAYQDNWYPTTDGQGFSLVLREESGLSSSGSTPANWRPSAAQGGSPGGRDPEPTLVPPVVINEALTHTDPPQVDTIELYNPTANPVSIAGWFLTDDPNKPFKYRIPTNTVVPASGFVTFTEADYNRNGSNRFALSSLGEELYLFSGDGTNLTGYRHGFSFGPQVNGVTFGRHVTSVGEEHFVAQRRKTLGGPNAGPLVGPVVINEILFQPSPYGLNNNPFDEFIELRNVTGQPVPLFAPVNPTITWRLKGGVQFTFPGGVILAPLSYALIVPFDPDHDPVRLEWFRRLYAVPAQTPIFGPYAGNLDNAGDVLELYRPDTPPLPSALDAGFVPYVLVDAVRYAPAAPWPSGADGTGCSLQRLAGLGYGNDPVNWRVAAPTAGSLNAGGLMADIDHDGLPDEWELAHGLDPWDPNGSNGSAGDADGDGMANLQEFRAGTDPRDARSCFRLETQTVAGQIVLSFQAVSNRTYTVQFSDALAQTPWQTLVEIAGRATNHTETIMAAPVTTHRFYRLLTSINL